MVNTLELVLALLAGAVLVVGIFRSLNLPPVLGYLMVGAAVGPHAMTSCPTPARALPGGVRGIGVPDVPDRAGVSRCRVSISA
ncbi:MAG: hypothetical protein IPJ73_21990 [Zoogloea sp.]|nr:hypothetical protein [Zoogloea sp.]